MHSDDADADADDDDDEHIIIIGSTDYTSDLGAVPLFALSYKSIHRQLKPRCALCPRRVRISWMRSADAICRANCEMQLQSISHHLWLVES